MRYLLSVVLLVQATSPAAWGWGAEVHRTITYLALDGLPPDAPAWLREPNTQARIAFQANQPDRWRGWDSNVLKHENDPEHYLDVEDLSQFGLTLDTLPKLRREYLRVMAATKVQHPDRIEPYDPNADPARAREWPGFVLHAVAENYAKLQAAFNQVRILEKLSDPQRQEELEQARAIAVYHLGNLSHFVGDIAQPLHTTKHYNGWVGDNPVGYKWRERFHSYVDSGVTVTHKLDYAALRPLVMYDAHVSAADPWADVLAALQRSHAELETLYALERDGRLDSEVGRTLIAGRLSDAAALLSALTWAAYTSAAPTEKQSESWLRYEPQDKVRGAASQPATRPTLQP
jgi:hypothetical protein